jgi:hypothetical protein
MRILTVENESFELDQVPDEVDDLRFMVLDNSDPSEPDYFATPLIFLESFNAPALVLNIGGNIIKMPVDWKILLGDPEIGDLEVMNLTSINGRDFSAFEFNPLSAFMPTYPTIDIVDVYTEVKWYLPKLKPGQLLAVPLESGPKPKCVYFVKELNKSCEVVDIHKAW